MILIKEGKTKDIYAVENGNILFKFKDSATGDNGVFNPGANQVGLSIDGMGAGCLKLSAYLFEKLNEIGIATHYISYEKDKSAMLVRPAVLFGKGLEVICRFRATGSFVRRYGSVVKEGEKLHALVEMTLKDDENNDPLITQDTLVMLNILSKDEYDKIKTLTQLTAYFLRNLITEKGMELYDVKLEFGRVDNEVVLIDEISAGSMRVYKNGIQVGPLELTDMIIDKED